MPAGKLLQGSDGHLNANPLQEEAPVSLPNLCSNIQPFYCPHEVLRRQVWLKATPKPGFNLNVWRTDICGSTICFYDYGNPSSPHGWMVDHLIPLSLGGTDDLSNLQPLHCENKRRKGESFLW
ncbi:MAG: HNH endonuclease [Rhodospirillales bacterium]|nr:MAG: HNH endonuclease [Rhodospirillales bacterium]